jgi:Fur family iron response transcriptional regulator
VLFDRKETFHFTIDNLKKKIEKGTKSKISLATVYNTVHAFKNKGYLKEISLQGNKTFFDTNSKSHHHFYDQDTGDLIDIKNEDINVSKLPSAPKGKKIKDIEVTVSVANSNHNQKK